MQFRIHNHCTQIKNEKLTLVHNKWLELTGKTLSQKITKGTEISILSSKLM